MTTYHRSNGKRFIGASRLMPYGKGRGCNRRKTLTERGINVDALLEANKECIELLRKGAL